jgi:type IV pilus assembly protein PilM
MSTDEALLDFCPTGEANGPAGRVMHGMLVAATKDTVRANVLAVESAGLRPQLVDLGPFAILRSIIRGDLAQRTVAVVDIGARITHVIIAANGTPRFVRILPSGGQNATDAVATAMSVSAPDAEAIKRQLGIGFAPQHEFAAATEALNSVVGPLVEAIRNTFVYYAGNNPGAGIDMVVLTGGGAHLPGLGQYLSSASRLAVSMGDPLTHLRVAKSVGSHMPEQPSMLTMPLGLAYGVAA